MLRNGGCCKFYLHRRRVGLFAHSSKNTAVSADPMTDREKSYLSHTITNSEKLPTFTESNRFIACRSIYLRFASLQNDHPHTDNIIEINMRLILISIPDNLVTALSLFFHRDHYLLSQTE